jgi:hypothetical protein
LGFGSADTVPVRIVNLNDVQALEAQLVENLIRADVHPMPQKQASRQYRPRVVRRFFVGSKRIPLNP